MSRVVQQISRGLCDVVARVRASTAVSCRPEEVEEIIIRSFNDALAQTRQLGIAEKRAYDLLYPFVALVDEVVLRGPANLRDFWRARQLQSKLYSNNRGGEVFFERINSLRAAATYDKEMLYAYLLVLALGFEGKFHSGEVGELLEVRKALARIVEQPTQASGPAHPLKPPRFAPSYMLRLTLVVGLVLALTSGVHVYLRMRYEANLREVILHIENMRVALAAHGFSRRAVALDLFDDVVVHKTPSTAASSGPRPRQNPQREATGEENHALLGEMEGLTL